jgi:hypothetical protein
MRAFAHHRPLRFFAPAGAALAIGLLAATPLRLPDSHRTAPKSALAGYPSHVVASAEAHAEHAIILGGILIERNRHLAAGSVIGCTIGAGFGAGLTTAAALVTGGVAFAALPTASVLGCAVFGAAGAVLGGPLDDYQMDLSDLDDGSH